MKAPSIATFTLAVVSLSPTWQQALDASPVAIEEASLCSFLERIEPGEVLHVQVSGVYAVSYEEQVLFDPDQPQCDRDVQPVTWVELPPSIQGRDELRTVLEESHRAQVTFQGLLYGPGRLLPDDVHLPFAAALAQRSSNRRYGHMNAFRTKLVVESVQGVRPVPESVGWEWGGDRSKPSTEPQVPIELGVPRYPRTARELGVSGKVHARVEVMSGLVRNVTDVSGDRLLSLDTVANIRTWRFSQDASLTFAVTFVYDLEWQDRGHRAERIELSLPSLVRITSGRYEW